MELEIDSGPEHMYLHALTGCGEQPALPLTRDLPLSL
jgi:hypothetical protein